MPTPQEKNIDWENGRMLRIYIGFQDTKFYCFPSFTSFLFFSILLFISIVFSPPPPKRSKLWEQEWVAVRVTMWHLRSAYMERVLTDGWSRDNPNFSDLSMLSCVCLFSNRYQNQGSGTRAAGECATVVFTTFWRLLWSITEQTYGRVECICFIQWSEKNKDRYTYPCRISWLFDICASLGTFEVPNATFRLRFFFFFLCLTCKQFLKVFQRLYSLKAE